MQLVQKFPGTHEYFIHDLKYDFYGKRCATCSSDQHIKIWDLHQGEWKCTYSWKAHHKSVWKVEWANPEFGQVLASSSYDRTVCIWEEPSKSDIKRRPNEEKQWKLKATIVDSTDSVVDIKFAPRHLGLQLATCSLDGHVRIYEAVDVMNLSHWPVIHDFEVDSKTKKGVTCLSWNPSRFDERPTLVVGCNDGSAKIFQYNEKIRKWQNIYSLEDSNNTNNTAHKTAVHDIAWAPSMGRSYHIIATASKDGLVKIWKYENDKKPILLQSLNDHGKEVWKVEWNITGTVLASSGDDGKVRCWKNVNENQWRCISVIQQKKKL